MGWGENDRGVSFTFGAEVVAKFLRKHDFDLICRAHQVVLIVKLKYTHVEAFIYLKNLQMCFGLLLLIGCGRRV